MIWPRGLLAGFTTVRIKMALLAHREVLVYVRNEETMAARRRLVANGTGARGAKVAAAVRYERLEQAQGHGRRAET